MKKLIFLGLFLFIGCLPIELLAQKKSAELDKLNSENAFFEALKQKAIGNYDKAIEALNVCYNLDSTDVGVLFELSKNFYWLKDYFESKQNLNKALKFEPKNIWLLEQGKNIAVAQQNYKEAIAFQNKIIAIKPLKKVGLLNLYLAENNKPKAIELINTIEKEQGINEQLKKIRLQLTTKTKPSTLNIEPTATTGLNALKELYKKSNDFKVLKQILAIELDQKNFELLKKDATDALEFFPSQTILYLYAAQANNSLKDYQSAIDLLDNGIDFVIDKKTQKNYYLAYANSYIGLKNIAKANAFKKQASQL